MFILCQSVRRLNRKPLGSLPLETMCPSHLAITSLTPSAQSVQAEVHQVRNARQSHAVLFAAAPSFCSVAHLFLSSHPPISLLAYADVLAISLPASLIFLCLPRLMFYLFLSSHPPISLVAYANVLAISLSASLIFLCLPSLMFYIFLSSHSPISLLP